MLAGIPVLGMEQAGVKGEAEEDQETFQANARKKAEYVYRQTGLPAAADDSGLCITALDGRPGVRSARWAGQNASDNELLEFTLDKLKNVPGPERSAWFECVVALVLADGQSRFFRGRINGRITREPYGPNRAKLPYDRIFVPQGHKTTFAQMSDREKNRLSHRGQAFRKLKDFLEQIVAQ